MTNLSDLPIIGDPKLVGAHEWGYAVEKLWPDQDSVDLAYACHCNGWGPLWDQDIAGLLMVQQGMNDEGAWVWLVKLTDGTHWVAEGGCDYTGWDCQSYLHWEQYGGE